MDFREIIAFALSSRNEVSQPWFATRLVATISFELCTQFRALCSALCSAPCFALCALHACALRSATCSALCTLLRHDHHLGEFSFLFDSGVVGASLRWGRFFPVYHRGRYPTERCSSFRLVLGSMDTLFWYQLHGVRSKVLDWSRELDLGSSSCR